MSAPHAIETARLLLTPPALADAQQIFDRYASDPEVTRYLGWPQHRSIADTETFVSFSGQEWARRAVGPYLIRTRADGRLIGGTGLGMDETDGALTGYVFAKDAWGHGYATEALRAMIDLARDIGLVRVYAFCHPDHRASAHVLEKCGFLCDANWTKQTEFPNLAPGVPQPALRFELELRPHRSV